MFGTAYLEGSVDVRPTITPGSYAPPEQVGASHATLSARPNPNAIEFLEGHNIRLTLRDNTSLQGRLQHIGWMNPDSEAISYLCIQVEPESGYVLAAQGIDTRSGILFIPWDWVACLIVP